MAPSVPSTLPATVVVIDDSTALLNALSFALQIEGFEAVTFTSAGRAAAWPGLPGAACLVIDQNLPDQSGVDFLARLRSEGSRIPAILITTHPPQPLIEEAKRLGAPIIEKPLMGDELFACIRAALAADRPACAGC